VSAAAAAATSAALFCFCRRSSILIYRELTAGRGKDGAQRRVLGLTLCIRAYIHIFSFALLAQHATKHVARRLNSARRCTYTLTILVRLLNTKRACTYSSAAPTSSATKRALVLVYGNIITSHTTPGRLILVLK
jgi:hypothetical protein